MAKINILCLHGFLGQGADWKPLIQLWQDSKHLPEAAFHCPDLLTPGAEFGPEKKFLVWAESLNNFIEQQLAKPIWLMGYSMGARLAMHLVEQNPHLYEKVFLLAGHAGGLTNELKSQRQKINAHWAQAFLNEPWDQVVKRWDDQEIFLHSKKDLKRNATDFDKNKLSLALQNWSLAEQRDLSAILPRGIHWLVGDQDTKYREHYDQIHKKRPYDHFSTVFNSGHRILIDNPPELILNLQTLLRA